MIESYLALAARIRQELADLEHIVQRAERALEGARHNPPDQDYYIITLTRSRLTCMIATPVWNAFFMRSLQLSMGMSPPAVIGIAIF